MKLEEALVAVWRQALIENKKEVELDRRRFAIQLTPKRGLRQIDFTFEGEEIAASSRTPPPNRAGPSSPAPATK